MSEKTSSFLQSLAIVAMTTGIGAAAGSLSHKGEENFDPAWCTDLADVAQGPAVDGVLPVQAAFSKAIQPFVCGEKAPFHPALYRTEEGREGGAVGGAIGLTLLAVAGLLDLKSKKNAGGAPRI